MDADLPALERIREGDEQGLSDLMDSHRESVFRFVYRFVRNEADAADLTEETFFRVYQNAGKYRPKAKVVTWIFAIAGNLCRDFLRKNKKRSGELSLSSPMGEPGKVGLERSLPSEDRDPEQTAMANEAIAAIETAIQSLPYKLSFPFVFCVLEGNSYDDCAEALGANRKTIEMRIYRARKLLREGLAEYS